MFNFGVGVVVGLVVGVFVPTLGPKIISFAKEKWAKFRAR